MTRPKSGYIQRFPRGCSGCNPSCNVHIPSAGRRGTPVRRMKKMPLITQQSSTRGPFPTGQVAARHRQHLHGLNTTILSASLLEHDRRQKVLARPARGVAWNAAAGCEIFSQWRQVNFSRTVWITFQRHGTASCVSVISLPIFDHFPEPQQAQDVGGSTTTCSRGTACGV